MSQPIRSVRRHGRTLAAALAAATLAACSDGSTGPQEPTFSGLVQLISRNPAPALAGALAPDPITVRVLDAAGHPLAGIPVSFTTRGGEFIHPAQVVTDQAGYASAVWDLGGNGADQATVSVPGAAPLSLRPHLVTVPGEARAMLAELVEYIPRNRENLVRDLPRNQHIAPFMQEKINLLRTPGLGSDILEHRRFEVGGFLSRSGARVPVTAVFPLERMRDEAVHYMHLVEAAVPVLEDFLASPFPTQGGARLWYGFITGMSGGGGTVNVEDRTAYNARTQGRADPYDAGIVHELGHGYVGNESLTQFLEVYGENVLRTGSADIAAWTSTRGWIPGRAQNEGIHALLDIYQLIGREQMAAAYRTILPMRPPFAQVLPQAVKDAFAAAVPEAVRPQVAARLEKVAY
jgi:hypothetical protein